MGTGYYQKIPFSSKLITYSNCCHVLSGAPNENIAQNHLNIALLNVFWYLNSKYRHIFIP